MGAAPVAPGKAEADEVSGSGADAHDRERGEAGAAEPPRSGGECDPPLREDVVRSPSSKSSCIRPPSAMSIADSWVYYATGPRSVRGRDSLGTAQYTTTIR